MAGSVSRRLRRESRRASARQWCGASEVVEAMLAVAQQASMENVSVDVTYRELTFSYRPDNDAPYTHFQTIQTRTFNYGKLTDVLALVERFCQGQLPISEAECMVKASALYEAYKQWCKDNQLSAMNGKLFGDEISKKFEKKHTKEGRIYHGGSRYAKRDFLVYNQNNRTDI